MTSSTELQLQLQSHFLLIFWSTVDKSGGERVENKERHEQSKSVSQMRRGDDKGKARPEEQATTEVGRAREGDRDGGTQRLGT